MLFLLQLMTLMHASASIWMFVGQSLLPQASTDLDAPFYEFFASSTSTSSTVLLEAPSEPQLRQLCAQLTDLLAPPSAPLPAPWPRRLAEALDADALDGEGEEGVTAAWVRPADPLGDRAAWGKLAEALRRMAGAGG